MGYVQEARENHVKKKVEEALRSKMKQKALRECDRYSQKYAECAAGRTISVVWQCRKQAKELNECLHQYCFEGTCKYTMIPFLVTVHFKVTLLELLMAGCGLPPLHLFCTDAGYFVILRSTNDTVLEEMKRSYMLEEDSKHRS